MKFKSYVVEPEPIKHVCKQPSIWGVVRGKAYTHMPLMYLQKPSWMDAEDFKEIAKTVQISFQADKEFKEK